MNTNKELINKFYSAFQKLDYKGMNNCYSDDIVFFDPVFGLLKGDEVRFMWEMLCKSAKDFSLTYGNIVELDEEYCTCDWVATYTFSKTGRKVVNKVKANMRFADGKIANTVMDSVCINGANRRWELRGFCLAGILFFSGK